MSILGRSCLLALIVFAPAATRVQNAGADDDLAATIARVDFFLQQNEVDGVSREPRELPNESEEVRLSVVPQLLAYLDLRRAAGGRGYDDDIVARADYLLMRQPAITTATAFDGMLGYALLGAWEATGQVAYRDAALPIVQRCLLLSGSQLTLNWGLMGAMALARWHRLTGDPLAAQKVSGVIHSLAPWQNADGSFPHYCAGTRDMHYTSWMSQELLLIRAELALPTIDPLLDLTLPFLEAHVDPLGVPVYGLFCTRRGGARCGDVFYSRGSGCNDYDTRGWINELGYLAFVLEGRSTGVQRTVMDFLGSLERDGAWRDKWAFPPLPGDPIYVWANGDPSVIRTSIIFWSLAALLQRRGASPIAVIPPPGEPRTPLDDGDGPIVPGDADPAARTPVAPATLAAAADQVSPFLDGRRLALAAAPESRQGGLAAASAPAALTITDVVLRPAHGIEIRFVSARGGPVRLAIHDVAGRAIGSAEAQTAAGAGAIHWDGRTHSGTHVPPGAYFARLRCAEEVATSRIVVLR